VDSEEQEKTNGKESMGQELDTGHWPQFNDH
jgi:hypothetical protein